jgi:hypothetical protein
MPCDFPNATHTELPVHLPLESRWVALLRLLESKQHLFAGSQSHEPFHLIRNHEAQPDIKLLLDLKATNVEDWLKTLVRNSVYGDLTAALSNEIKGKSTQ